MLRVMNSHADQLVGAGAPKTSYDCIFSLTERDGWHRFETPLDSDMFGIWINQDAQHVFIFDHAERTLLVAQTPKEFDAEIQRIAGAYGSPAASNDGTMEVRVAGEVTFKFPRIRFPATLRFA